MKWAWLWFSSLICLVSPQAGDMDNPGYPSPSDRSAEDFFSDEELEEILHLRKPGSGLVLFQVLEIGEGDVGTRNHHSVYKSKILGSMQKRPLTENLCEWNPSDLKQGGFYLASIGWCTEQGGFLGFGVKRECWFGGVKAVEVSEGEALAAFDRVSRRLQDILIRTRNLPDGILQEALAGKSDIVIAKVEKTVIPDYSTMPQPPALLKVKDVLIGKRKGHIKVTAESVSKLRTDVDYLIAVSTGSKVSDRVHAVEIYPGDEKRILDHHKARIESLAAAKAAAK